jgi:hypothetical protein
MPYIAEELIAFVKRETACRKTMTADTTLEGDLRICGDDHHALMEKFGETFQVDMSRYRWEFHTDAEGFMPLLGLLRKKPKPARIDITIQMLLDAANRGAWAAEYPAS